MKNKIAWLIGIICVIILVSLLAVKFVDEDSWICTEKGWIEHGKPNSPKPTTICSQFEKQALVEKYLRENISNISPQKEVLGGKFYITKIIWFGNNSATIEYEDGHIVVAATFDYKVETDKEGNNSVVISDFKIAK